MKLVIKGFLFGFLFTLQEKDGFIPLDIFISSSCIFWDSIKHETQFQGKMEYI
jgi:hypothetical protein